MRKSLSTGLLAALACTVASVLAGERAMSQRHEATFDARGAAAYLDARMAWWAKWPTASRDHGTVCVSCHTALPYALARPALRASLAESQPSAHEQRLIDDVVKRVRLWKDVEPFYPDQTGGIP